MAYPPDATTPLGTGRSGSAEILCYSSERTELRNISRFQEAAFLTAGGYYRGSSACSRRVRMPAPPRLSVDIPGGAGDTPRRRVKDPLGLSVAAREGTDRKLPRGHQISTEEMQNREVQAIFHVMRENIKAERTVFGQRAQNARSVFRLMDRDGNGALDRNEFKKAVTRMGLGLTDDQVDTVMRSMDKDLDAQIQYEEFLALIGEEFDVAPEQAAAELAEEQRKLDKNRHEAQRQERLSATATHHDEETKLAAESTAIFRVLEAKLQAKGFMYGTRLSGKLEQFFDRIDKDGSGNITAGEFGSALHRLGLGLIDSQIEHIITLMDTNGDGEVNFEEFFVQLRGARPDGYGFREEGGSPENGQRTSLNEPGPRPPTQKRPMTATEVRRAEFEKDMSAVSSQLRASSRGRTHDSRSRIPVDELRAFAAGRIRQTDRSKATPVYSRLYSTPTYSRSVVPWPPPMPAPKSPWQAGPNYLVQTLRDTMAEPFKEARLGSAAGTARFESFSPRSTRSSKGSDSAKTVETKTPWSPRGRGQNKLFYSGSGTNPSGVPAEQYSEAWQKHHTVKQQELEKRAISIESGSRGLKRHLFSMRTRMHRINGGDDEPIRRGDRIGKEYAASTELLRPWIERGELPPTPAAWQVHGRMEGFQFEREELKKDHPRRDRPTLDYARDIVESGATEQVVMHGSSPRSREQFLGVGSPRALPQGHNYSARMQSDMLLRGGPMAAGTGKFGRAKGSGRLRAPEHILPAPPRAAIYY